MLAAYSMLLMKLWCWLFHMNFPSLCCWWRLCVLSCSECIWWFISLHELLTEVFDICISALKAGSQLWVTKISAEVNVMSHAICWRNVSDTVDQFCPLSGPVLSTVWTGSVHCTDRFCPLSGPVLSTVWTGSVHCRLSLVLCCAVLIFIPDLSSIVMNPSSARSLILSLFSVAWRDLSLKWSVVHWVWHQTLFTHSRTHCAVNASLLQYHFVWVSLTFPIPRNSV